MRSLAQTAVFCLVAVASLALGLPSVEFNEHVNQIIQSEDTEGFDIATVHAVDSITNEEIRQTKRDIEEHASDSSTDERTFSLRLSSGEQLRMSVQRRSIDLSGATFTEVTEDGEREITDLDLSDCFFSGHLEDGEGFASLSLCNGEMVGSVSTPNRDYHIHTLPQPDNNGSPDDAMSVLVTWQDNDDENMDFDDTLEIPEDSFVSLDEDEKEKRTVHDHRATVEVCDVVDKYFIADAKRKLNITTNSQLIELLISKWSGAAHMLSNETQVGWDLNLRLVNITIMRTHPSWYTAKPHEKMGARLNEICRPTGHWKCDQISLHTGATSDRRIVGLAWVGGVCNPRRRCSALRSSNRKYMAELHELGHNLGLKHDVKDTRCINGNDPVRGFMGGNAYHFRECYKEALAGSFTKSNKRCLFSNVVTNTSDIVMDFPH